MRKVTTGQVILSKLKPSLRTQDCAQQCSKNMVILLSHIKKKTTENAMALASKGGKHVGVATGDRCRSTQNPDLREETHHFSSQFPSMDFKAYE